MVSFKDRVVRPSDKSCKQQPNLTLYTTTAFLILDSDGQRVLAKYYRPRGSPLSDAKGLSNVKEQKGFEKGLWEKTKKAGGVYFLYDLFMARAHVRDTSGDIILFESYLAVYKHISDVFFYIIGSPEENELMLNLALSSFTDALSALLRSQVEKRAVLENYDLTMLCLDETIDDG